MDLGTRSFVKCHEDEPELMKIRFFSTMAEIDASNDILVDSVCQRKIKRYNFWRKPGLQMTQFTWRSLPNPLRICMSIYRQNSCHSRLICHGFRGRAVSYGLGTMEKTGVSRLPFLYVFAVDVFYGTPSWLDEVERKFQDRSDAIFDRMQRIVQEHKAFLGSVSDYAAHHADCPMLIVKPHEKPHEHAKFEMQNLMYQ